MSYKEEMSKTRKQIDDIHAVLLGSIEEGRKTTGVVAQVHEHQQFINFWKRFIWAVIVAGLTIPPAVVTAVILSFVKVPTAPIDKGHSVDDHYATKQELVLDIERLMNKKNKGV